MNCQAFAIFTVAILSSKVSCKPAVLTKGFFEPQNVIQQRSFEPIFGSGEADFVFVPVRHFDFEPFRFDGTRDLFFAPLENFVNSFQFQNNFPLRNQNNHQNANFDQQQQLHLQQQRLHHEQQQQQAQQQQFQQNQHRQHQQQQQRLHHDHQQQLHQQQIQTQQQQFQQNQHGQHLQQQRLHHDHQQQLHHQQIQTQQQQFQQNQHLQQHQLLGQSTINVQQRIPLTHERGVINQAIISPKEQEHKVNFAEPNALVKGVSSNQLNTIDGHPTNEHTRSKHLLKNIIDGIQRDLFSDVEKVPKAIVHERKTRDGPLNKNFVEIQTKSDLVPSSSQITGQRLSTETVTEKISRSTNLLNSIIGGIRKDIFPNEAFSQKLTEERQVNRLPLQEEQDLQPASSNRNQIISQQIQFPVVRKEKSRSELLLGGIVNGIRKDIFSN